MKNKEKIKPQFKRVRTEESIKSFKDELLTHNWESVLQEDDMDKAYENFLNIFKLLYIKTV